MAKKFIPPFLISLYHLKLAFLGAFFYGFPSRRLKVIGVTGTNGKSTTVYLITQILKEAGFKTASLSSIEFQINDKKKQNTLRMTMPGRFFIQKFFREAARQGCQYAVLEVTSEGILQHRHRFINFQAAVFTNLTPEHIERHGGFENYKKAKARLFGTVKNIHVINLDDEYADYFLQFKAKKKYGYTLKDRSPAEKGLASIVSSRDIQPLNLKLPGEFNVSNSLAAVSVGLSQGISLETCKKAVEGVEGIPGRMEEVISAPFKVIVDYAFTPNALEKVYKTLKYQNSKLICVLGAAGGGRDKWKRPVLGQIASEHCDKIIITNEDPYDENPLEIMNQIEKGCPGAGEAQKILDRREAIKEALKTAKTGDRVIITGKGCEPSIYGPKGKKIPWDDRQVAREEFERLNPKN